MSDIQPGDVVVCVNTDALAPFCPAWLRVGRTYRVADVFMGVDHGLNSVEGCSLVGYDHSPMRGFVTTLFRKIRPADEQFTAHIRALKPVREDA